MNENIEKIRQYLGKSKNVDNLKNEDDLFKCGFVDSLFAFQLVIFLEKEFKIKIKNKDITEDNFRSVEKIAATVDMIKNR